MFICNYFINFWIQFNLLGFGLLALLFFIWLFPHNFYSGSIDIYRHIETMKDAMSKILSLICMKDYLRAFIIGKGWAWGDELLVNLNSKYFFVILVPNKDSDFSDLIVCLSEIMLIWELSFAVVEIAFDWLLLDFGNVDPSRIILIVIGFAKDIILKQLLMLFFGQDAIKGIWLFNSTLLVIDYFFSLHLECFFILNALIRIVHFFW